MAELVSAVYADALFGACIDTNTIDDVSSEYNLFEELLKENPRFLDILTAPSIKKSEKKEILKKLEFSDIFRNFLCVLLDKARIYEVGNIKTDFDKKIAEHRGITTAYVKSATDLTEAQIQNLKKKLGEISGKTVEIVVSVDPSIIAGLSIRIGDTVLEASFKSRLGELLGRLKSSEIEL